MKLEDKIKIISPNLPEYLKLLDKLNYYYQLDINYIDCNNKSEYSASEMINDSLINYTDLFGIVRLGNIPYPIDNKIKICAIIKPEEENDKSIPEPFALLSGNQKAEIPAQLSELDIKNSLGSVYLVGAGQSNIGLLTLKAIELIRHADIIFYDSLINKDILNESCAKKVFVGKRANKHYKEQDDINRLLFQATLRYKTVVRLKGGDPMIFGHAGEEIAYLESRLVNVEVVPGISSALGASSLANIPLTLRNVSNSVSFCSAHTKSDIPVPKTDTIVYFMGAGNLKNIAKSLSDNNWKNTTPLTLFYNIGASDQKVYYETIDTVLKGNKEYKAPLLIIVGEVGNRKIWYRAFEHKPKILYTGTNVSNYAHLGYVIHHPMIEITALEDYTEVDNCVLKIKDFDWLVFTSRHAVEYFFNRLFDLKYDTRHLSQIKIASIGHFTSSILKKYGIVPNMQSLKESSIDLAHLFKEQNVKSKNILIPRSNLALNHLPDALEKLDNQITRLTVYQNRLPKNIKKIDYESFDKVIFSSPSGVNNFIDIYGELPRKPELITKGKETQAAINKYLNKP